MTRRLGARWAKSSAKPIRSPTICATCCATRKNSASRSGRTPAAAAQRRGGTRRRRRAKAHLEGLVEGGCRVDPGLPGRTRTARADPGADGAVLPQAARPRGGLSRAGVGRSSSGLRRARRGASAGSTGATGLLRIPRFQRWAAASPLTRVVARRRAKALFDLCAGFVYSQILLACVRLRLFEILAARPAASGAVRGAPRAFAGGGAAPAARRRVAEAAARAAGRSLRARRPWRVDAG